MFDLKVLMGAKTPKTLRTQRDSSIGSLGMAEFKNAKISVSRFYLNKIF